MGFSLPSGVPPLNHIRPLGPAQRVLSTASLPAKVAPSCSCLPPPQPRRMEGLASPGPSLVCVVLASFCWGWGGGSWRYFSGYSCHYGLLTPKQEAPQQGGRPRLEQSSS